MPSTFTACAASRTGIASGANDAIAAIQRNTLYFIRPPFGQGWARPLDNHEDAGKGPLLCVAPEAPREAAREVWRARRLESSITGVRSRESSARHEPEKEDLLCNRFHFCLHGSHLGLT